MEAKRIHQFRPVMAPMARELYQMAIEANNPTADLCQWEQSCRAESMARELAECGAYQLRQIPKPWNRLPSEVQAHFRHAAEQAIRELDLTFTDKLIEAAVAETVDYMNGPGNMKEHAPSIDEIARESVHRFQALRVSEVKL